MNRIEIQKFLTVKGFYKGNIDGIFGPKTVAAIRDYQKSMGQPQTGVWGDQPARATEAPYKGLGKALEPGDVARVAAAIKVDTAALEAVRAVESAGRGFDKAGRVLVLYEPHIAYRKSSGDVRARLVKAGLAYPNWGAKPYPKTMDDRFQQIEDCAAIAGWELACDSSSWGLAQIMGFNAESCGYHNAVEMVKAFADDEENQLSAMGAFIMNNSALHRAMQKHDWAAFAEGYNGAAYRKNQYDRRLADEYSKHR